MTVFIRNEKGGVQSVTDEHYGRYLTTRTNDGGVFPLPGVTVLTEDEAREAHPQLFGVGDPQVTFTDDELARQLARKKQLRELFEEDEAVQAAKSRKG
jgi:hypothetical protein